MSETKTEDLVKFDPTKLAEQVQARVRGAIVDLIPEDAWKQMVQREIKLWMEGMPEKPSSYGPHYPATPAQPPGVRKIVQQELDTMMREKVKAALNDPEHGITFWDGQTAMVGPKLMELIVASAPAFLNSIIVNIVAGAVQKMKDEADNLR